MDTLVLGIKEKLLEGVESGDVQTLVNNYKNIKTAILILDKDHSIANQLLPKEDRRRADAQNANHTKAYLAALEIAYYQVTSDVGLGITIELPPKPEKQNTQLLPRINLFRAYMYIALSLCAVIVLLGIIIIDDVLFFVAYPKGTLFFIGLAFFASWMLTMFYAFLSDPNDYQYEGRFKEWEKRKEEIETREQLTETSKWLRDMLRV